MEDSWVIVGGEGTQTLLSNFFLVNRLDIAKPWPLGSILYSTLHQVVSLNASEATPGVCHA